MVLYTFETKKGDETQIRNVIRKNENCWGGNFSICVVNTGSTVTKLKASLITKANSFALEGRAWVLQLPSDPNKFKRKLFRFFIDYKMSLNCYFCICINSAIRQKPL